MSESSAARAPSLPRLPRASGVLLHPTSLPGPHGIGDLGEQAYRFADYLRQAEQRLWQIMPLGPTGYGDSPYAARSAFAGNPLLISLEVLRDEGLLQPSDMQGVPESATDRVNFGAVQAFKLPRLRLAFERFVARGGEQSPEYGAFRERTHRWLDDFTLFMGLLLEQEWRPWWEWPAELARREPAALVTAEARLAAEIGFQRFQQYQFDRQWSRLRAYANQQDVHFVGDIPIFVAQDSADVWARPDQFKLDPAGRPLVVSGVPPDYYSPTGQLWGNPIYHWERQASERFAWWVERFRAILGQVDVVRIDHFRGFQAAWEVPAGDETAEHGTWTDGPGAALFHAVIAALGPIPVVLEDLGLITPEVESLREQLGYPGMKVLHFAFGDDAGNPYLPHNYQANCVVYTGTHDNDTSIGWFRGLAPAERGRVQRYLGRSGDDISHDLLRLALMSVADTAIIPLQDVLGLGPEARMNVPGRPDGNWSWRVMPGQATTTHADGLADLTRLYGRAGPWIVTPG